MTTPVPLSPEAAESPRKLLPRHRARLAVVYVRQSSLQQVHHNQESTRLQYSLAARARAWGWSPERVLTLDDDLGLSGTSAVGRHGFQRLLAEVALDHVGLVLGAEMSRLARSNRDWHQLLELCARFGTLIADLDGLYDPADYNDRLLLGLKGTMSEAEVHILRQRLVQGKLQKARRGALSKPVPTGYLRLPNGEVVLDPDEEVRAVVAFVFATFERVGTVRGVLRALVREGLQFGVRRRTGEDRGRLEWHPPHRGKVLDLLRNPIYAGAYVYGRRQADPRRQIPGRRATGRTPLVAPAAWLAVVYDRHPAYITWAQYEGIQARLAVNQAGATARATHARSALLPGLVVCGRCQRRMVVQYTGRAGRSGARYVCNQAATHHAAPVCCGVTASCVDRAVSAQALAALTPAALAVSLRVRDDLEHERARVEGLWKQRLERAQFEVARAARQYHAVEPEHRLVARTLEDTWEAALAAERDLREQYARDHQHVPQHLTADEQATIRALAADLPAVWRARSTTADDRRTVLRQLLERVVATVDPASAWVAIAVHWAGGHVTHARVRRPVAKLAQTGDGAALMARLHALRRAGLTAPRIAAQLDAEGWTTPRQLGAFNARLVRAMLARHGTVARGPTPPPQGVPHAWWLADLARELKMPLVTLYGWMRRGWVEGRWMDGHWALVADAATRRQLRQLRRTYTSSARKQRSRAV